MQHPPNPGTYVLLLIAFLMIALRLRRMARVRPMRLTSLWILPAILTALAVALIWTARPSGAPQMLVLAAVVVLGALLGWHQAKLMAISVDAQTGTLQVKASVWGLVTFLAVVLLRAALRPWLTGGASPLHAYLGVITDALLLFPAAFYCARAAEMHIRGSALLRAARAGRPA